MSPAVNGSPSDHSTPSRMSNVQVRPSSEVSHDVARAGTGDQSASGCHQATDGSTVPCVTTPPSPPQAPREAHEHAEHGVVRADPYHWMRRTDDPALLTHLVAERIWYDTATGHLNSLVETLRSEMMARVPSTDRTVSWRLHGCSYYTALPAGREHPQ